MSKSDEYLDEFINEMRKVIKRHDLEKGERWKTESRSVLIDNLYEEIHEFEIKDEPMKELIDIANSCYILWAKSKYFKG